MPLVRQLKLFMDKDLLHCGRRIHNPSLSELANFPTYYRHIITLQLLSFGVSTSIIFTVATLTALWQSYWYLLPVNESNLSSVNVWYVRSLVETFTPSLTLLPLDTYAVVESALCFLSSALLYTAAFCYTSYSCFSKTG